jgi:hypothetical protein
MTEQDMKELEELRLYKQVNEGRALNRAFARLQQMLDITNYEPTMSIKAFRVLAECLICLRDENVK